MVNDALEGDDDPFVPHVHVVVMAFIEGRHTIEVHFVLDVGVEPLETGFEFEVGVFEYSLESLVCQLLDVLLGVQSLGREDAISSSTLAHLKFCEAGLLMDAISNFLSAFLFFLKCHY